VTDRGVETAAAFAPGHVTGIFAPDVRARDPRARGSVGAGVVLELGAIARAEFRAGARRSLRVESDLGRPLPISEEVARRLRPTRSGALTVRLVHELPVGQGFGMSAAGATATALAVAGISGRSRADALEAAHLAELFGGGGLGGVAAIAGGGGLEIRRRSGIPPRGDIFHVPLEGALFVGTTGPPLPSPNLLRDRPFLERVRAASLGLEQLTDHAEATPFFVLSEQFTDRLGLAPRSLRRVLAALRERGAWAAQAMFGRSFFARPKGPASRAEIVEWLESSGLRAVEIAAARRGARRTAASPPHRARRGRRSGQRF
jgi:pantoate kinase